MRKPSIIIGILAAALIVAALIFWATFDINRYRGPIQANLEQRLSRSVTLGPLQLDLFPPSFRADKVVINDDPKFGNTRPFVQAERLNVSVKFFPLLRRSVQITSLSLTRPQVELIKNEQGAWNFSTLGPAAKPAENQPRNRNLFSLDDLEINDGQVAMIDRKAGQARFVYDHIDISLKDFSPGKQFSVQVAAHLPGQGNQEVRFDGTGGPVDPTDISATPLRGTLDLTGARLAGLQQFLKNPALAGLDGKLTGKTNLDIRPGVGSIQGSVKIEDPRIRKVDLGYPITAEYKLQDDFESGVMTIASGAIKLGNTPLALGGTVDTGSSPAKLHLNVSARGISLAEASRLAAAFGVGLSPNTDVKGRAVANIQVVGTTEHPAMSGTVSAADINVTGKDMAVPAQIKSVNFRLSPTDIRSDDFVINYGGTPLYSRIAVTRYNSATPVLDANLEARATQLPAILKIAEAYGVKALDNLQGDGNLSFKMHLSGPVHSLEGNQILRNLSGESSVDFNHLQVNGTNLGQEISKVAGFLKPTGEKQGSTDMSQVTGHFAITNGVAETNDLKAAFDLGKIGITGSADLAAEKLDFHVNAVVAQKVAEQVGGTQIGGYMRTVLANGQGELVVPVLVTGTFQNPQVSPDVKVFAQMKLKGLIPNSNDPTAGLAGIIGDVLGDKAGNQQQQQGQPQAKQQPQQQQQKPPENPLEQILKGLGKKKQSETQKTE